MTSNFGGFLSFQMTRPAVQCIALAVVCDIARAGDAVGQLVSWRANLGASNAVTLKSDQELRVGHWQVKGIRQLV